MFEGCGRFSSADSGHAGEVALPQGATRVDLAGKTVMSALVDAHVHMGHRKGLDFSQNNYTRENLADILDRFAYYAVAWTAKVNRLPDGFCGSCGIGWAHTSMAGIF
jgi:cytosine/adenosine deaminase-related metal-dependent hydrolase